MLVLLSWAAPGDSSYGFITDKTSQAPSVPDTTIGILSDRSQNRHVALVPTFPVWAFNHAPDSDFDISRPKVIGYIGVLPTRIILDPDELVTVHLRDTQSARTVHSEAILDVNSAGRWIRGIELVGGGDFNLETVVKPFNPRRPLSGESTGVTYDEDAYTGRHLPHK